MKYINAAEILPEKLLKELQIYIEGEVLYIPKTSAKKVGRLLYIDGKRLFMEL